MNLSAFKTLLSQVSAINFVLPNGSQVPNHFHVTEVGLTTKQFVDCGGTLRTDKVVNFQVWSTTDFDHRLEPAKLLNIISIFEKHFGNEDHEVEVEYQSETIGRYGLNFNGINFLLTEKQTNCLASDQCGIPDLGTKSTLVAAESYANACCSPGGGCC